MTAPKFIKLTKYVGGDRFAAVRFVPIYLAVDWICELEVELYVQNIKCSIKLKSGDIVRVTQSVDAILKELQVN